MSLRRRFWSLTGSWTWRDCGRHLGVELGLGVGLAVALGLELVWESGSALDLEWGVGDVDGNGFGVAVGLDRELRGLDAHTAMLRSRLVISNSEFKRARHARSPLVCLP